MQRARQPPCGWLRLGIIEHVLRKDVFVLRSNNDVRILVHPVHVDGRTFLPCAYAYATTIRRAQGSTLQVVGLYFDRRCADRGRRSLHAPGVAATCDPDSLFRWLARSPVSDKV